MPDLSPIRVAFLLFPDVTQLDLTGPAQVLSRLGNATIDLVAKTREPVPTDAGFALLPTATFDDAAAPDILCVPGGFGVNHAIEDEATLAWVRRVGGAAEWVTSVCTGSLLLGAAGLLRGYRATCHWAQHHHLAALGAIPVKERYVIDRNRATGGGVTAGIDFGLALVAAIRGEAHAKLVQLSLEYDPQPPFDAGAPERADAATLAWVRRVGGEAQWVTSVCTGSLLLGAAGLLRGYRATCHWAQHHHLAAFGAIPVKERFVIDRNRATGGGVTAGIDFGLALVAAIRGEAHARLVQLSLEYDPQPPFDAGAPERADAATLARYHALAAKGAPDRDARTLAAAARLET